MESSKGFWLQSLKETKQILVRIESWFDKEREPIDKVHFSMYLLSSFYCYLFFAFTFVILISISLFPNQPTKYKFLLEK